MSEASFDKPCNKIYQGSSPSKNVKIRFLPFIPLSEETENFNSKRHYNVISKKYCKTQGIGRFYQENSLLDLGQSYPVYEYKAETKGNQELPHVFRSPYPYFNDPDFRPKYRFLKPKGLKPMSSYITKIYVIEDEECLKCNGRAFFYRRAFRTFIRISKRTILLFTSLFTSILFEHFICSLLTMIIPGSHFEMGAGPIRLEDTDEKIEEILP